VKDFIKVTAAIIIEDQKVLITQRHPDDTMGGKWEFPGGKVEPGETPEACLRRELHEELGILVEIHNLYAISKHAYPHVTIELLVYNVTIRSGQITLNTHQDYRWVAIGELAMFDFSDADKPIVEKLRVDRKSSPWENAGETPALPGGERQAGKCRRDAYTPRGERQAGKCRQDACGPRRIEHV
jgi:8-oxo-dGTP diphosphatase